MMPHNINLNLQKLPYPTRVEVASLSQAIAPIPEFRSVLNILTFSEEVIIGTSNDQIFHEYL